MSKKSVKKALIAIGRIAFSQFMQGSEGCCCRTRECPCCRKLANDHGYTHDDDCPIAVVLEEADS